MWCGPSDSGDERGILQRDWIRVGGGDGTWVWPDPLDPTTIWSSAGGGDNNGGQLSRYSVSAGSAIDVSPYLRDQNVVPPHDLRYRFNWEAPLAFSPFERGACCGWRPTMGTCSLRATADPRGSTSWFRRSTPTRASCRSKHRTRARAVHTLRSTATSRATCGHTSSSPTITVPRGARCPRTSIRRISCTSCARIRRMRPCYDPKPGPNVDERADRRSEINAAAEQ